VLPEQSLAASLKAEPNQLTMQGPVVVEIPGGTVEMDSIRVRDLFLSPVQARSGVELGTIQTQPLLSPFWSDSPQGTIRGTLSTIVLQDGKITTTGAVTVNLFGGEIVISNIQILHLFSSIPVFKLDGVWHDLNLARITTGTEFGKIEGIVKGHVKNLEIAAGQPQRFQLLLETEKKSGVDQRISVKAVENIAQLGGGQSPFMGLAGTVASLFQTFPYEKIGARASLENDIFRINGLIHEDGVEYLVKRGGFVGVNVVNQNPDNRIRFKDMVKRVKRITSSETGPVIE